MRRICMPGVTVLALLGAAQAEAAADAADAKTLHDYTFSMDKAKRYDAAAVAWQAAGAADPSLKAEGEKMSDEPDKTLADIEAKFDRHPRVYAFFAKQGLSKQDAATLPIALMDAMTVVQMPQIASKMADRVSASQVAFCKTHLAELKSLKFMNAGGQ